MSKAFLKNVKKQLNNLDIKSQIISMTFGRIEGRSKSMIIFFLLSEMK